MRAFAQTLGVDLLTRSAAGPQLVPAPGIARRTWFESASRDTRRDSAAALDRGGRLHSSYVGREALLRRQLATAVKIEAHGARTRDGQKFFPQFRGDHFVLVVARPKGERIAMFAVD